MGSIAQPSDNVPRKCPGCDWGWVWIHRGTPGVVRPCERHQADLYDLWLSGKFRPRVTWSWTEAA
jgi:hypothetical protein